MVSGWQIEERGKIIYNNKLPNDIRLSTYVQFSIYILKCFHVSWWVAWLRCRGMAELITEVLAGLMENDISKMWEFDQFFMLIERIYRKKVGIHTKCYWNVVCVHVGVHAPPPLRLWTCFACQLVPVTRSSSTQTIKTGKTMLQVMPYIHMNSFSRWL